MKTKFIFLACIIAALLFTAGMTKESFDFKAKVVPQTSKSSTNQIGLNKAAEVINKRLISFFEIPQENIKLDIAESQILLTLHNVDTSKVRMITNVITSNNTLEFWETYENSQTPDLTGISVEKTALLDSRKQFSDKNPQFSILGPRVTPSGELLPSCMIGLANEKDTSVVNRYLQMDTIKALFPDNLRFYWGSKPYKYDPTKALSTKFIGDSITPSKTKTRKTLILRVLCLKE